MNVWTISRMRSRRWAFSPTDSGATARDSAITMQLSVRQRHLAEEIEETALARGVDRPVDGRELKAVDVVATRGAAAGTVARVEVAARRVMTHGRNAVVRRLLEIEVV